MDERIKKIVIVGGGTAGWLTAGLLAARHKDRSDQGIQITLIESPDIATIGVGEGTWPTIRKTLSRIGIKEADFLNYCGASFKQGSRFDRWVTGGDDDVYHHPFELPVSHSANDLVHVWQAAAPQQSFAETVCVQAAPELDYLAPRQKAMPDFVGAMNYAYHLDAVRLTELLRGHITKNLGVTHLSDHVTAVNGPADGDIKSVTTRANGDVEGDLFIDCTGHRALLIGQHYGMKFIDQSDVLFNDRALVTQIEVDDSAPIVSETISTAHEAGWTWDIGLQKRRGIGCVYASKYMDEDGAQAVLADYLGPDIADSAQYKTRLLKFNSGHRGQFWHKNCLAIGQSAGFLEPLEASAIVMVELAAERLAENLPVTRRMMEIEAGRFNGLFSYRWARIIDFLKLHYVLSRRSEPYWRDNRDPKTMAERLANYLEQWQYRPPSQSDFEHASEVFPAASYQFIVYGMGMTPATHPTLEPKIPELLRKHVQSVTRKRRAFAAGLPTNRALLSGLQKDANSA